MGSVKFTKVLNQVGSQTLYEGYGYTGLYLPYNELQLRRANLQDDSFLRMTYVQQDDAVLVLEAHEAKKWELEEYGNEF